MSVYIRAPKKTVAHCPYCPWIGIYFADIRKRFTHNMRAWLGLQVHIRTCKGKR